jgi:hypothetical protein
MNTWNTKLRGKQYCITFPHLRDWNGDLPDAEFTTALLTAILPQP